MQGRTKITGIFLTAAVAMAAVWGVIGFRNVYAQTPTPPQTAPQNETQPQKPWGFERRMRGGPDNDEALATALGISTDQLSTAYQTARSEALKQAVSQGLLTQAQADEISARGGGRGPGMRGFGPDSGIDFHALLADALGITPEQLQAAQQKVMDDRLAEQVSAGKMTQAQADAIKARQALHGDETFQSSMQTAYEAAIKDAAARGVLTQAQAEALLAQPFRKGEKGGPDFGGRHGGRR